MHLNLCQQLEKKRRTCELIDLCKKLVPYGDAWNWQKDIVKEKRAMIKKNENCPDTLIILQHHPVYTLGTGSSVGYLNFDEKDAPFEVYRTERGGEVTYHGPGQLVMYPIINLRWIFIGTSGHLRRWSFVFFPQPSLLRLPALRVLPEFGLEIRNWQQLG